MAPLQPLLAPLLIHAHSPPLLPLLLRSIKWLHLPASASASASISENPRTAIRLLLSDGQLTIQGLLLTDALPVVEQGLVTVRDVVGVKRYEVIVREMEESMGVCLAIGGLENLGRWEGDGDEDADGDGDCGTGTRGNTDYPVAGTDSFSDVQFDESFFKPLSQEQEPPPLNDLPPTSSPTPAPCQPQPQQPTPLLPPIPPQIPHWTPQTLTPLPPTSLFRNWTPSSPHPLKLTTLSNLPYLPYKTNWSLSALAVITLVSPVTPSSLPASPFQRICRIIDPSTARHVRLTVFLEPGRFTPRVGEVVLLGGVKNHGFEGGCVNKYENDKPKGGKWWWAEDELGQFSEWCRYKEIQEWWDEGRAEREAVGWRGDV